MKAEIRIGNHLLGDALNPYIIAEIGVNHEGSLELAKELILQAKRAGAHAAKFQSYKADKIASKNSPAYWDTKLEPTDSQHALFKKFDSFDRDEYFELADFCKINGIDFMSTPFDLDAVDYLDELMPAYKVASADITNIPLIRKCAEKGKPLILSTGASTFPEIENAISVAKAAGAKDVILLHCVLNYPTPIDHAQLFMIERLIKVFPDHLIGYSDHVVPDGTISALEVAVLKGACVLEKHFTHDKNLPGNDHYHAMDMHDLMAFKNKLEVYKGLLTGKGKDLSKESLARKHARRSIVTAKPLAAGTVLSESDLIAKRPAHGISPIH